MTKKMPPYFTYALKPGTCAESGILIKKGDKIAYYPANRRVYANNSQQASELRDQHFASVNNMADANY